MKPILAWIKKNLVVVICCAVIVLSLPLAWFFSSSMNAKLKGKQQQDGDAKLKEVTSKKEIAYRVLIPEPGREPITEKAAPNEERINAFAQLKKQVDEQAAGVVASAQDFNRGVGPAAAATGRQEFKPLVEGVFPGPAGADELEIKLREFEDAIVGKGRPSPYEQLLKSINAGGPQDSVSVAQSLGSLRATETEKIRAGTRELTKDETETLNKRMGQFRIGAYQARAREISVFATLQSLPQDAAFGRTIATTGAVRMNEAESPGTRHLLDFLYQWDLWLLSDVLHAVQMANTIDGKRTDVMGSVVKRIERIRLADPKNVFEAPERPTGEAGFGGPAVSEVAGVNGMAPLDPAVSITGRTSAKANEYYEVREFDIRAIVSSKRLPQFIDALSRSNFMTVVDLDLEDADVLGDLAKGYYYGDEHVIRATIRVESIWLRSWLSPLMPKSLRATLGIKLPGDDAAADPNAPPHDAAGGAPGAAPSAPPPPAGGPPRSPRRPPGGG